jgi:hypothetical protein
VLQADDLQAATLQKKLPAKFRLETLHKIITNKRKFTTLPQSLPGPRKRGKYNKTLKIGSKNKIQKPEKKVKEIKISKKVEKPPQMFKTFKITK